MWGDAGAWELYSGTANHTLSRSGRRTWSLSFSYLQDSDVFPVTSSLTRAEEYGYSFDYDTHHDNTLLYGDDFYANVIHKTNGGQLPFLFQPDKDDNTNFAIAKFDMNSFKYTQVSMNTYNISLKIREVW